MPTEFARELDEQLLECKAALQGQAQAMLELLLQFEARLQERLQAAEARIEEFRVADASRNGELSSVVSLSQAGPREPVVAERNVSVA